MRIASWNINSLRLRIQHIPALLSKYAVDVLCLQETKVSNPFFPLESLQKSGYPHIVFHGQKGYNGVAILSRLPLGDSFSLKWGGSEDARHIAVCLPGNIELHNFYVPAGGDIPDVALNPKFAFKLDFLDHMALWFTHHRKPETPIIITGDFNVAPLENDVWSHKQLLNVVSHTPIEVEKLSQLQKSLDWIDSIRHFVPHEKKLYSWWSYRNRDWKKSNRGRRLDHIWHTQSLHSRLHSYQCLTDFRDLASPSDHIPIIATFK